MRFQSAPGGEAGGNLPLVALLIALRVFQSAPGGEAGGNSIWSHRGRCVSVSIRPRR